MSDDKFEDFSGDADKVYAMLESKDKNYSLGVVIGVFMRVSLRDGVSETEFDENLSIISNGYKLLKIEERARNEKL